LDFLRDYGVKLAVGSSSRNAKLILERTGLSEYFVGVVSDGTNITRSKPDPQVFLMAAEMVGENASDCWVIEDADAGIEAAKAAGMRAVFIGPAVHPLADGHATSIDQMDRGLFVAVSLEQGDASQGN